METTINCNSGKKNFLVKTWKRCQSWSNIDSKKKKKVAPEGCFPVCVGPDKQRFAVKTKYANHPLFTKLLEDAETEYGYDHAGPISLSCDVDLFCQVLAEIEGEEAQPFFAYGPCSPFNPSRRLRNTGADEMMKLGYGSYVRLTH